MPDSVIIISTYSWDIEPKTFQIKAQNSNPRLSGRVYLNVMYTLLVVCCTHIMRDSVIIISSFSRGIEPKTFQIEARNSIPRLNLMYALVVVCYTHILRDSVIIISSPMLWWLLWEETSVQVSHTKKTRQATKCDRHAKIQIFFLLTSWIPIDNTAAKWSWSPHHFVFQPFLDGFSRNEIHYRFDIWVK